MSKPVLKTNYEAAIEVREKYQKRLIENMVNVIYFSKQKEGSKPDTKERLEIIQQLERSEKAVIEDSILMESFDELIESFDLETIESKE